MNILLTDNLIANLKVPDGRNRFTLTDIVCVGLSLEIRASGQGSWRYRYSAKGRQRCISLGLLSNMDLAKAREACFFWKSEVAQGRCPFEEKAKKAVFQSLTLINFVDKHYLPHIKSYKRCVTADVTLLKNHILPEFGAMHMVEITRIEINKFIQKKVEFGYKASYCNRFLVLLSFMYTLAGKWDLIGLEINPVKGVSLLKVRDQPERYLAADEAIRLMTCVNSSSNRFLKYFVKLALMTGARKRELLDSKWIDFDFEKKLWIIPMTKSGRPRYVPLTDEAVLCLKELRHMVEALCESPSDNPWVFPNPKTGKPFNSIFRAWDIVRRAAGLADLRIHDLRHSFASALVNHGVPIYEVQKLLGHRDIKTTERYAHLAPDRLRNSVAAINQEYQLEI